MNATSNAPPARPSRRRATTSSAEARWNAERHQNNIAHAPDLVRCLCPACHLKPTVFPRRQDGRIVLPDPSGAYMHPPQMPVASAPNVSKIPIEPSQWATSTRQDDMQEGSSTIVTRLSGPGVPDIGIESSAHWQYVGVYESSGAAYRGRPEEAARQRSARIRRSSHSDRSWASRPIKTYEIKPSMNAAFRDGVRRVEGDTDHQVRGVPSSFETRHLGRNLPPPSEHVTSQQSGTFTGSHLYNDLGPQPFSQFIPPLAQFGASDANLYENPTMLTEDPSLDPSRGSHHNPNPSASPPSSTSRSSSQLMQIKDRSSSDQSADSAYQDDGHPTEDPPRVIRFNSRSRNPQPQIWTTNNQTVPDKASEGESPHAGPSEQPQTHTSRLRFQNPVTPQTHVATATRTKPRENTVVQVKWDSERKRRQGYFSQEDGTEKSPFRHYNKTGCDFDS